MTSRSMSQGGKNLCRYCAFRRLAKMIRATDGDYAVTQDLSIRLLAAEKEHLLLVRGN